MKKHSSSIYAGLVIVLCILLGILMNSCSCEKGSNTYVVVYPEYGIADTIHNVVDVSIFGTRGESISFYENIWGEPIEICSVPDNSPMVIFKINK